METLEGIYLKGSILVVGLLGERRGSWHKTILMVPNCSISG